jgi:hypothetical protein
MAYRDAEIKSSFSFTISPSLRWYKLNSLSHIVQVEKTFQRPSFIRVNISMMPASTPTDPSSNVT